MRLKITKFGQSAEGIQVTGDPKSGEPTHIRIAFPGGDVEVVRAKDGEKPDYWVHVRVDHKDDGMNVPGETLNGVVCNARLDVHGVDKPSIGEFNHPGLYHLAVRVHPNWEGL